MRASLRTIVGQDNVNFLLTNRIPRYALTRFMGWFSKIEFAPVRAASIKAWGLFCDVDLSDAQERRFRSLHAAFIRELQPGARTVDPDPAAITSPCDAIVGAFGRIESGTACQIKGAPYPIAELLGSEAEAAAFENGWYVTLRLTAGMYHRFHAPHDLVVEQVRYIAGDTWNVNPIALKRIERLFCKNERAPITVRLAASGVAGASGQGAGAAGAGAGGAGGAGAEGAGATRLVLVPVAAVLVASIRLPWFGERPVREGGERVETCAARFAKGEEMGWFEHGSTIVVLAPAHCAPAGDLTQGREIRMGEALLRIV